MKKNDVEIGGLYIAKVSGHLVQVRIDDASPYGGWHATSIATGRAVRIKSAQRLRARADRGRDAQATAEAEAQNTRLREEREASPDGMTASERAMSEPSPQAHDPDRCSTSGCAGTPAMTYLGRPLCAGCWAEHCPEEAKQTPAASVGATTNPAAPEAASHEENDMATKTTKKPGTKSTKAKGTKKAAKPAAEAKPKKAPKGNGEPKRMSALDAAAAVLKKAGKPMGSQDLITAMSDQGLWTSPGGKTPHATLYAAMVREITTKGKEARFAKVDRGQFAYNG